MIDNILLPLPFLRNGGDCFPKKRGDSTIGLMWERQQEVEGGGRGKRRRKAQCPVGPLTSSIPSVNG